MNKETQGPAGSIGDFVALKIQELYKESKIDLREALLKIDNREEAAQAPFQFDPAAGLLHRRDCKAIPKGARTALYGVWRISAVESRFACPRCNPAGVAEKAGPEKKTAGKSASERPAPEKPGKAPQGDVTDLLYGVLSIVSQFGGVLRERGREFRKGGDGGRVKSELEELYAKLGEREKGLVMMTLLSLDQITRKIRDLDQGLSGGTDANGHHANGHDGRGPNGKAHAGGGPAKNGHDGKDGAPDGNGEARMTGRPLESGEAN
jgi:hypothetical protein